MKLRDAMVCMDCEEVFEPLGMYRFDIGDIIVCPTCSSWVSARLSRWIPTMREVEKEVGA